MRRETPSLAVLLVGAWIVRLAVTDDYKLYVKDSFGPWLLLAGGLLIVAALTGLIMTLRGKAIDHAEHSETADEPDGEHHHRSYVGWLLLAPLFAFILIVPRPLGSYSAERAAGPPPPPASQEFAPLPAGDPVALPVRDFTSRAVFGDGTTLQGRTVAITGFVTEAPGEGFYLTRLVIACCAADALPVKVYVAGDVPKPADDTWVEVTGVNGDLVRDATDSYDIATIEATSVVPVAAPASPYEQ